MSIFSRPEKDSSFIEKRKELVPVNADSRAEKSLHAEILENLPGPVFRMEVSGKVSFKNKRATELLNEISPEERRLQLYRLSVIARNAVKVGKTEKADCQINGSIYRIEAHPAAQREYADLYFTEISESLRIKNYFEVQSAFATALLEADTVHEVVWSLVRQAVGKLGYEDCVVYLLADDGITLEQYAAHGPKNPRDTEVKNPIKLKRGEGISGSVAESGKGEIVNDTSKDPRYVVDDERRYSEITVPITDGNKVIGIIDSEHRMKNFYSEEDLSILTAIASMASTKIQRIKTTEAAEAGKAKTQTLIDNAFGGIYILRNGRFEMVNTVFRSITGYSEEELTSVDFDPQILIGNVEKAGVKAMRARAAGDRLPKSYQLDLISKHSEIRRVTINTVILEDERGPYTLGIALDITQMIESERRLKSLNSELSERNEELRQFAQLASHNLRAPVSNMIGLLDLYEADSESNPLNTQVVQSLSKAVSDLSITLEEMHSVLRMRAEETRRFGPVNLTEVLRKTCEVLAEEISASGIRIVSDFETEEIRYVYAHIENFFFNLVSNAVKYRSPHRDAVLNISCRSEGNWAEFEFADNGIGIDLDRHGKDIFGMYKRFHNHPDSRGIGLYLVHAQLKNLGGNITVESESGKGTTFILRLKLSESADSRKSDKA